MCSLWQWRIGKWHIVIWVLYVPKVVTSDDWLRFFLCCACCLNVGSTTSFVGGGRHAKTTRWPWQTNLNMLNQSNWRVGGNKCCVCSMPAIHRNLLFGSSFKTFWQINVVLLRGEYGRMAETKRSWRKGTTRSGACGLILFTGGAVLFGSFCKFNEHIVVLSALVGMIFKHGHHIKGRQQARKFPNLSAGR